MASLERCIVTATTAHLGQSYGLTEQSKEPYVLHSLRVMMKVSPRAQKVAVLHDVVEDTEWEHAQVARLLDADEAEALYLITRQGQRYHDYIDEMAQAPGLAGEIVREVKLADLHENLSRLPEDHGLRHRYGKAIAVLSVAP